MFEIISKINVHGFMYNVIIIFHELSFKLHYDFQSCIMHLTKFMTEHENWTIVMSHLIVKKNMQLYTN